MTPATLRLDFAAKRVDLSMQVDYGGSSYVVNTRSSEAVLMKLNPGQASFDGTKLPTTGCAAASTCGTSVQGMIVGESAQRAGFAYQINDTLPGAAAR